MDIQNGQHCYRREIKHGGSRTAIKLPPSRIENVGKDYKKSIVLSSITYMMGWQRPVVCHTSKFLLYIRLLDDENHSLFTCIIIHRQMSILKLVFKVHFAVSLVTAIACHCRARLVAFRKVVSPTCLPGESQCTSQGVRE